MSALTVTIIVVAAAILVGVYVSWRAGRLDRLHTRVETARASLDAALVRRSAVALELAACGLLDPATSLLLAGAAHDARAAGAPDELAESDLTRALRAALGQPGFRAALAELGRGDELLAELEAAAHQVFLARRFYNDAVRDTRALRGRRIPRLFRLAGRRPLPRFFEIDDSLVTGGAEGSGADMLHFTSDGDAPGPPGQAA